MANKVKLELRPYTALGILKFLREFVNDENRDDHRLVALHENVDEYEKEVHAKVTVEMIEDALLECKINELTGRHPEKP